MSSEIKITTSVPSATKITTYEPKPQVKISTAASVKPPGTVIDPHSSRTTNVHGIADTSQLVTQSQLDQIEGLDSLRLVHNQITPAQVWTVVHNFGGYPSVTVQDSSGKVVHGVVHYLDDNTVRVTFSSAMGGKLGLN